MSFLIKCPVANLNISVARAIQEQNLIKIVLVFLALGSKIFLSFKYFFYDIFPLCHMVGSFGVYNIIQIKTDHEGNRENCLARRIEKQLTIAQGEAEVNSQLFPGKTESRDSFPCCPRDLILFVLLYHYICVLLYINIELLNK